MLFRDGFVLWFVWMGGEWRVLSCMRLVNRGVAFVRDLQINERVWRIPAPPRYARCRRSVRTRTHRWETRRWLTCGGCTRASQEAHYDTNAVVTGQARGSLIT
jgi:hypothetical protein